MTNQEQQRTINSINYKVEVYLIHIELKCGIALHRLWIIHTIRDVLQNSIPRVYRDTKSFFSRLGTITLAYIYIKYKTLYFLFVPSSNKKSHRVSTFISITNKYIFSPNLVFIGSI